MLAHISDLVGRDRRGRWAAVTAGGQAGAIFVSRDAALRYARLETRRKPGAVASSPVQLALSQDRVDPEGEGLPAWWRLGPSTQGSAPHLNAGTTIAREDKRWLMLDIAIAVGFVLLCLAVGSIVS